MDAGCRHLASSASGTSSPIHLLFILPQATMATMEEFIKSLEGDEKIKMDVVEHLSQQGLSEPSDLGFLANKAGKVNEGIVHRGCPTTWMPEHFHVLHMAIEYQSLGRGGQTALTLLRLTPAFVASVRAPVGAPASIQKGKGDTRWCSPILVDDDAVSQASTSGCALDTERRFLQTTSGAWTGGADRHHGRAWQRLRTAGAVVREDTRWCTPAST